MTYTSIATVLHDPEASTDHLEFAIQAARQWDAHLHIVCIGVDATEPGFYYAGAQAVAVQQNLELARDEAHALETAVRNRMKKTGLKWDVEVVTLMSGGLEAYLSEHIRFQELVILPLPRQGGAGLTETSCFEACLFGGNVPVLVVPQDVNGKNAFKRILVAWDDGAEALSAIRAAGPLTAQAEVTDIHIINPPQHGVNRSDPGGRLAQALSRLGAKVQISISAAKHGDIAAQLLQNAHETGADLLVMGGYGHSRLREAVLGGVTRSMLRQADIPVLLAH